MSGIKTGTEISPFLILHSIPVERSGGSATRVMSGRLQLDIEELEKTARIAPVRVGRRGGEDRIAT